MSVFDGSIKTARAVPDPGTDHQLPSSGCLSYGSIKSTSALAGTSGVNVALVTGNSDYQLIGNLLEHVSMNMTLQVDGNLKGTVAGNSVTTVVGTTSDTRIGNHQHVNVAPRTDIFNHTRTELHSQPEQVKQPTERCECTSSDSTENQKVFEFKYVSVELIGLLSLGMNPSLSLDIKNRDFGINFLSSEANVFKQEYKAFHNDLAALKADIKGGKVKAALTHAKAIGLNLNAGLAVNADSPWA